MTFCREWEVNAVRRGGRCDGCRQVIAAGEPATRWAGMTDGDFGTALYHRECRAAEIGLNKLHDTYNMHDWLGIGDLDPDDRDWLIAEHPIVAVRKGLLPEGAFA